MADRNSILAALLGKLKAMPLGWEQGADAAAREAFDLGGGFVGGISKVDYEPFRPLLSLLDDYNNVRRGVTPRDLLETIEQLPTTAGMPKTLSQRAAQYRNAMDDDFANWAGRGDVEPFEDAFIMALDAFGAKAGKALKK